MIKFQLTRNVLATIAVAIMFSSFAVTSSAGAIGVNNINGEIGFVGRFTADNDNLVQATELLFPDPVDIVAGTGDFEGALGSVAEFNAISLVPDTPGNVLTFAGGGSFTSTLFNFNVQSVLTLVITLTGYWSLDGFNDTLGQLVLTATNAVDASSFSATGTVTAVPVPAAVWLMGSALAGLGLTRRRV